MAKQIDVYRDWLGVKETERPLNYYQIFRLRKFEDDAGKIREHYRKMNAHVRKFAAGDYAKQSQELLNELAKAMLCLTDAQRKAEYDATLGRASDGQDTRRKSLEELLLRRNVVDQEKLSKARSYASAVGIEIRDALIQQKIAPADVVMPTYAESIGLPFLDLAEFDLDTSILNKVPAYVARQNSLAPVMIDNNQLLVASSHPIDPQVEDEIRLRAGLPVRTVICTPAALHELVNQHYTKELAATELASSAVKRPAAKLKSGDGGEQGTSADAPLTVEQYEERKNNRRNVTLVAFNFSFMLAMVLMSVATSFSPWLSLPIAVLVGAIGAAVAWSVAK